MAKAKAKAGSIDYEILCGTTIDGELRRKGETIAMTPDDAAGLLALGKIQTAAIMEARRKRLADRAATYRRRDMNPEQ